MEAIRLKNGAEEMDTAVATVMTNVKQMMASNPMAVYELVSVCRDRNHVLFGGLGDTLKRASLIERINDDGTASVHDSIRNIVLSAAVGEDMELRLIDPREAPAPAGTSN